MHGRVAVTALLFAGNLIVAALAAASPAQSQTPAGTWTQEAPMPAVRGEVAAAAVGDRLFAVGGSVAGKAVARNEEYDPATDRWRPRAPLPQARDHLGVAVLDRKIYAFGGFTSSVHQGAGDGVFEYDPTGDRWQMLTPMSAGRASVGVAVLAGKLHVIGGRGLDGVRSQRMRSMTRRRRNGVLPRHCCARGTTWRWWRPAERYMRSADVSRVPRTALDSTTSMIPREIRGHQRRRFRRRVAGSLPSCIRT
jgi:hypothetical protein